MLLPLLLLDGKESAARSSGPVVKTEAWMAPSMKRRTFFTLYIISRVAILSYDALSTEHRCLLKDFSLSLPALQHYASMILL